MAIYAAPYWIDDLTTNPRSSPYFRAPLPHPGSFTGFFRKAQLVLEGRHFILQYRFMGSFTYPRENICGYLTYRSLDTTLHHPDSLTVGNEFGMSIYADNHKDPADAYHWTKSYGWNFVDKKNPPPPPEDPPDPETPEPEDTYEDVVQWQAIHTGGTGYPVWSYGVSETVQDFRYKYSSTGADGKTKNIRGDGGHAVLSGLVTRKWLEEQLQVWKDLPSTAKRRTNETGYYGTDIISSGSTEGYYAAAAAGIWWLNLNLADDAGEEGDYDFEKGWTSNVTAHLTHTTRQNAPVVVDSKRGESYVQSTYPIYNSGKSEILLGNEIVERKWLDNFGRYDASKPEAFISCPFQPAGSGDWQYLLQGYAKKSQGGMAMIRLFSADGGTYRVTLQLKGYMDGNYEEEAVLSSAVVDVEPGTPGDFDVVVPENSDFYGACVVHSVRKKISEEDYVDITATAVIAAIPDKGVTMLAGVKVRRGWRWGYASYDPEKWPEELPAGVWQSEDMRFFRSQIFRAKHIPTTQK